MHRDARLPEWKEPVGRLEFRQPCACETLLFKPLFGLDNGEHLRQWGNSWLDVGFGFEQHFVRGLKKMRLRMGLALIVMLAIGVAGVKKKRRDKLRSLV